jgi:L-threonylcarbamoyladenylate synthase
LKTTDKRIRVDSERPARVSIVQSARAILSGGLVVFPTRCLYGLAADALNEEAVQKVFRAKGRSPENPVLILVRHQDDLKELVTVVPETAAKLMARIWPGGLTLVFPAAETVPAVLTAGTGKIGIRLPSHPVARALVAAVGRPITGTSANVSGRPGCADIELLAERIATSAAVIIDSGALAGGAGSTVVDVTRGEPVILRSGAVPDAVIREALAAD